MADPTLYKFEDLVLEVEFDPVGAAGTYTTICGLKGFTINRSAQLDEDEVPADCADESLPFKTLVTTRSLSMSVQGDGKMAKESFTLLNDWYRSGGKLNAQIRNTVAAVGDIETEGGPASLETLNNEKVKGRSIDATIAIRWDGAGSATKKVA